jgi:hypothetical protein
VAVSHRKLTQFDFSIALNEASVSVSSMISIFLKRALLTRRIEHSGRGREIAQWLTFYRSNAQETEILDAFPMNKSRSR